MVLQDSDNLNDERDPEFVDIPDKVYFKIGEVSDITGVEPHVLRYWESEIKVIRPQRASSKQRLYRRGDIEKILTIKKLLQEDGYTIPGAKKYLTTRRKRAVREPEQVALPPVSGSQLIYRELKAELEEIKKFLER